MPDWSAEGIFPGVFDGIVFDSVVFDVLFQETPEDHLAGSWTAQSSTSGSWTPQSSTS